MEGVGRGREEQRIKEKEKRKTNVKRMQRKARREHEGWKGWAEGERNKG